MALLYFFILAMLEPSSFSTTIAVLVPIAIAISAFFYAKFTHFIFAIMAVMMKTLLDLLTQQETGFLYIEELLSLANIADGVMVLAIIVSTIQGILFPKSVVSCYRILLELGLGRVKAD